MMAWSVPFLLFLAYQPPATPHPDPDPVEEVADDGSSEEDADTMEWDGAGSDDPDEPLEECSAWVKVDCFVRKPPR